MEFRQFEREFLRLAFTTRIDLSPAALAFVMDIPIAEAEQHMQKLLAQGVLELASDDEGHLHHVMPHRPAQPMALDDPALVGHQQIIHQVIEAPAPSPAETPARAWLVRRLPPLTAARSSTPTSAQAVASMLLNALVCPGLGSLVGGRPRAGISQLSIFLVGLPLAVASFGVPLMVAAWVWGVITGAHLIAEARD